MKPHNNITKYSRTLDVLFYNTNLSKLKGFLCEDILVEDQISSDLSWKSSITFLFKLNSQNGSLTNSFAFEKVFRVQLWLHKISPHRHCTQNTKFVLFSVPSLQNYVYNRLLLLLARYKRAGSRN